MSVQHVPSYKRSIPWDEADAKDIKDATLINSWPFTGPLTIPGDPWSLSGQKNQILAKKLGTNPDKNQPKYPKSQIHYPDRKTGKYYSMSTNPDKYWHGAGASAASLLIFFNC